MHIAESATSASLAVILFARSSHVSPVGCNDIITDMSIKALSQCATKPAATLKGFLCIKAANDACETGGSPI